MKNIPNSATTKGQIDLSSRKPGPVPPWVDRNSFRVAMLGQVNKLTKGRWGAISMRDGIIWFRYSALVEVLRECCNRDPDVLGLQVDAENFSHLIFTILKSFNDRCVVWGMLGKGFMATKCRIINSKGKTTAITYLTPIRTTWLNILPGTLERFKPNALRNMVGKIEPVWRKL
ncbi:hypothetical protein [Pelotalea chapellei]|uniref:Uncharacterized protein n=1 Tax=Pelotalea chapellei TaxID=44671 RepID=A0ABS5U3Q9_9BACT|nr:hypothetical protein [Pelotalea chapellei]MBT1070309.1 hypothetical protein [Pelotalea chapellei]